MMLSSLNSRPVWKRLAALLGIAGLLLPSPVFASDESEHATTTPIKHLVVIFQENVSFDHYFGTYPVAANQAGEPQFEARPNTPGVNGLSPALRNNNPNGTNPFRLDRSKAATCDQDHNYNDEQFMFHGGLMDRFVQLGTTGTDGTLTCSATDIMGYFDGNTVTAMWNYAQNFAMSDNSFGTTFGPSTPGALNLVSGQTHGATAPKGLTGSNVSSIAGNSMVGDLRPYYDDCSPGGGQQPNQAVMSGKNIGDLLNQKGITWGWFQGGFRPTSVAGGKAVCGATHTGSDGLPKGDYIPHHEPFQYYASTTNQHHLPPSAVSMIGKTDQANHQYDLADFWSAADNGNLPEVSFLKARGFEDGHAGYSDPLAEQRFVVTTINRLQRSREWRETAIIIAYDDSDGWYDHVMGPIVMQSSTSQDELLGPGTCGTTANGAYSGRCGYGPRLPLLVVSPWAKQNYVAHNVSDQSSILRFIEDNWDLGQIGDQSSDAVAGTISNMFDFKSPRNRKLMLDPATGLRVEDDDN
ncbi:MAG: alkaline phosphatase family protein [Acidobacteria bacterium]|nr:alkaline phosphatase family protein [Acidobacteriota bacterium]